MKNNYEMQLLDAHADEKILDVLRRNGIYIPASCGVMEVIKM